MGGGALLVLSGGAFCCQLKSAFFQCRNTPTNKNEVALLLQLVFFLHYYADERNYCSLVFIFIYRTNIPYLLPSHIVRRLLYSILSITLKCTLTFKSMLFISWTSCQLCLFEFIWVEGGVKFMKHLKGAQAIKVWEPLGYTTTTAEAMDQY
jgi:hypothetical protein